MHPSITKEQRLEWHERQLKKYEGLLSECKDKASLRMVLDSITSHKMKVTALKIELGIYKPTPAA